MKKKVDLDFGIEDIQLYQSDYQISVEDVMSDMEYDVFEMETFGLEDLDIKGKAKAAFKWILKQLKRLANFFKALWNKVFNKEKKIEKTIKEIKTEIKKSGSSSSQKLLEGKRSSKPEEKHEDSEDEDIKHSNFVAVIKADTKTPSTIVQRLKKCDTSISVASDVLSASIDSIKQINTMSVSDGVENYMNEVMQIIGNLNKVVEDKLDIEEKLNYTKHFDVGTLGGAVKAIDEMFRAVVQINLGFKECSKVLDSAVEKVNVVVSKRGIAGVFEGALIDTNVKAMGELSRHLYQQVIKSFNDLDTCSLAIKTYIKKLGGHKLESTESVDSVNRIVESIIEEYGVEGVTNIIRNLSK